MSVNIPVVNAGYLSVQNLEITIVDDETLTIAAGQARDSSNVNDIVLSAAVTVSNIVNGVNGLDTGSVAASTLYAIYLVGDSSQNNDPAGLLSLSTNSAPTLPVGYDMYRLIGYVRTDATSDNLLGYFSGSSNSRVFTYDVPIATAITAGNSATYAAVTLTTFVPPVENVNVLIESNWTANAAADTMALQPLNAVGDTVKYIALLAGATAHTLVRDYVQAQLDTAAPKINYKVSAGTVALNVAGYQYSI